MKKKKRLAKREDSYDGVSESAFVQRFSDIFLNRGMVSEKATLS